VGWKKIVSKSFIVTDFNVGNVGSARFAKEC